MSKEKKPSKDDLLYVFNELVTNATTFKPKSLQQERDEAIQQIYRLIESSTQEPSEAEMEELINKWAEIMCNFRTAPKIFRDYKLPIKTMFKEYDKLRRG